MNKWQPIETAPKDEKRRLLGYSTVYGIAIIKYDGWGEGSGQFEVALDHIDVGEGGWVPYEYFATHWMPLPEPPK